MSKVKIEDISSYTYKGNDKMIDLESDKIPPVHKNFKASLKLKSGREIPASRSWRDKIWCWWYQKRKDELIVKSNHAIIDVANSMLNQKHKIQYND
jgi:hypothetical protein